jgi:hypothetical protein
MCANLNRKTVDFLKEFSLNNVKSLRLWVKMTGIPGVILILVAI